MAPCRPCPAPRPKGWAECRHRTRYLQGRPAPSARARHGVHEAQRRAPRRAPAEPRSARSAPARDIRPNPGPKRRHGPCEDRPGGAVPSGRSGRVAQSIVASYTRPNQTANAVVDRHGVERGLDQPAESSSRRHRRHQRWPPDQRAPARDRHRRRRIASSSSLAAPGAGRPSWPDYRLPAGERRIAEVAQAPPRTNGTLAGRRGFFHGRDGIRTGHSNHDQTGPQSSGPHSNDEPRSGPRRAD